MKDDVQALVNRLQAALQEELAGQRELHALLREEERAARGADTAALTAASGALQRALVRRSERERRRAPILRGLARAWGADARALTLASIAERLGASTPAAERLAGLRRDLRDEASRALRLGRRIAALARHHGALLGELTRALAGIQEGSLRSAPLDAAGGGPEQGVLFNVEA